MNYSRLLSSNFCHKPQKIIEYLGRDATMYHTDKYYSKNLYLFPEEMPEDKNYVGGTVFHAIFNASGADTARICYLK